MDDESSALKSTPQIRGFEGAPSPLSHIGNGDLVINNTSLEFYPSDSFISQFRGFKGAFVPLSQQSAVARHTLQFRKNMHQEMYLSQPLKISSQRIQIISFASLPLLVEIQEFSKKKVG